MGDADPAYFGFLGTPEAIDKLNRLLEAERAGVKVCRTLKKQMAGAENREKLADIERDEAFCCAMLTRQIQRLGGVPSRKTGDFVEKIMAIDDVAGRLRLLVRGQQWVADFVRRMLPVAGDDGLYEDLKEMLEQHERNIAKVAVAL